jgi:hypothetical protein
MTNRIKPGPGIGPTWEELFDSGQLRPGQGSHAADEGTGRPGRKPDFARPPNNGDAHPASAGASFQTGSFGWCG